MEIPHVFIHFFGDGRDTYKKSGAGHLKNLIEKTQEIGIGEIATVVGRYYIMDRDKRWERVEIGMKGIVLGEGEETEDPVKAVEDKYSKDETDEFLKPIIVGGKERRVQGESTLRLQTSKKMAPNPRFRQRHLVLLQLSFRPSAGSNPAARRLRPLPA